MIYRLLTSTAVVLALAGAAADARAQAPQTPAPSPPAASPAEPADKPAMTEKSGSATAPSDAIVTEQKDDQTRADNLIGMRVSNPQNENIGKVSDLVIENDGRVSAVLVSVGGFLGIGDKHVAVPWDQVKVAADGKSAMISMNKGQLEQAPAFKTKEDKEAEADRARRATETEAEAARQRSGASGTGPAAPPAR
ncbi:MAG TPA: PRC-barrel domain-containing protein [Alphaproteobacteria bacterium]